MTMTIMLEAALPSSRRRRPPCSPQNFSVVLLTAFVLMTLQVWCAESVNYGGGGGFFRSQRRFKPANARRFGADFGQNRRQVTVEETRRSSSSSNRSSNGKSLLTDLVDVFETDKIMDSRDGSIDLLGLLRACRIFERKTREMGKIQIARNLAGNIEKIEKAMSKPKISSDCHQLASLLKWERDVAGIHKISQQQLHATTLASSSSPSRIQHRGGWQGKSVSSTQSSTHNNNSPPNESSSSKLADPSGAKALLWLRRTISFQHKLYKHILENDGIQPIDAANMAYKTELEPYHGGLLRRLFRIAVKAEMPPESASVLAKLGGFGDDKDSFGPQEQQAVRKELQTLVKSWEPLLDQWKQTFEELGMEDTHRA